MTTAMTTAFGASTAVLGEPKVEFGRYQGLRSANLLALTGGRIQLGQGSAGQVARTMIKEEGFGSLYKGLSAGLLRQATYATASSQSSSSVVRAVSTMRF